MSFTIISDIGNAIVKLLRENMVPDTILKADGIGLASPDDKGDLNLGICLYDIRDSEEVISTGMRSAGIKKQVYPATYVNLYYMITPYSMSDIKFRAAEEQRILGRVIQVLRDNQVITERMIGDGQESYQYKIRIEMDRLEQPEKVKIWPSTLPYKLSLFYKVYPVEIESTRSKEVPRVTDIEFTVKETEIE